NQVEVLRALAETGADAVHPGYGFLSENAEFARAVAQAGAVFIGPSPEAIQAMGLKDAAKARMEAAGVPVVPGYLGEDQSADRMAQEAAQIGYPVLIKARAGGGGKGMRKVDAPADFPAALESCQREGAAAFGDPTCLVEKWITTPRHIEVQVFGDAHGNVVHLYERDCTLQRRHQKVIEEAPAPGMTSEMRAAMGEAAVAAARAVGYQNAGTVEFIVDATEGLHPDRFYFMEMNTRLQVEHPVTEAITGQDLVEWQIRVARGEALPLAQADIPLEGWAMEARVYAEDPSTGFLPSTGKLDYVRFSTSARIDTGVRQGDHISPYYDPMIAKVIVTGETREATNTGFVAALTSSRISGPATNLGFLAQLAQHPDFVDAGSQAVQYDTGLIGRDEDALVAMPAPKPLYAEVTALLASGLHVKSGWALWEPLRTPVTLEILGDTKTVWLASQGQGVFATELDGVTAEWRVVRDTGTDLTVAESAEHVVELGYVVTEDAVVLWDGALQITAKVLDPLERSGTATIGDVILAPMPGQVRKLSVAEGREVSRGDTLAVLEAMKMEHELTAPRAGLVSQVRVAEGDQVAAGDLIIALEPDDG
ncbi:MAG: biotin/lipoyl-containing protein, partial [Pseudomonadota bacterium]